MNFSFNLYYYGHNDQKTYLVAHSKTNEVAIHSFVFTTKIIKANGIGYKFILATKKKLCIQIIKTRSIFHIWFPIFFCSLRCFGC